MFTYTGTATVPYHLYCYQNGAGKRAQGKALKWGSPMGPCSTLLLCTVYDRILPGISSMILQLAGCGTPCTCVLKVCDTSLDHLRRNSRPYCAHLHTCTIHGVCIDPHYGVSSTSLIRCVPNMNSPVSGPGPPCQLRSTQHCLQRQILKRHGLAR
jgi:hypothetical protein